MIEEMKQILDNLKQKQRSLDQGFSCYLSNEIYNMEHLIELLEGFKNNGNDTREDNQTEDSGAEIGHRETEANPDA